MSVLDSYFNMSLDQCSPVFPDVIRVVRRDEDGREFNVYEPIDYPSIQKKNGSSSDWSLSNLLKAGINPDFPIHTSNAVRLEGLNTVRQAESIADSLLNEDSNEDLPKE